MPIYEYSCDDCSHNFEVIQKASEKLKRKCPACGKFKLKKIISPVAFRLKGSGWYETDFKTKQKPAAKAESKANASAEGGDKTTAPSGDKSNSTENVKTSKSSSGDADSTKAAGK